MPERRLNRVHTRTRLQLCLLLAFTPLLPIAARLVFLQIVQHKDLSSRANNSTARELVEIIPRGRIVDRNNRVLAQSLPAWSSFLDLKVFNEEKTSRSARIERLAAALDLEPEALEKLMDSKRRNVWLKRKMSYEEVSHLRMLKLRSIGIVMDEKRFYPNDGLSRSLLGSVDAQGKGSAGLEYQFNSRLSGRAVRWELTRDGSGQAILHEPQQQYLRPPDLKLTLDRTLQFFVEKSLAETVHRHQAQSGSVLIQDPNTGELLAMAVYPSDPFHNSIVQDVYEPGSTFKIVTAAAALETKTLGLKDTIDCENGKWQLTHDIQINDHEKHAALTLSQILQYSSNIGSAKIGQLLGAEEIMRYANLFGFGYKTGVPLPAESAGIMKDPRRMNKVRLANASFGQGIAVTPLQLISAYSVIANGGTLFEPRLVSSVSGRSASEPVVVRRVITEETAKNIQKMLELVVDEGTGISAQIPGYRIAGKTGTAQKVDPKTRLYSKTDYISSFAGYLPASAPRYTILIVIDSPQKGYYGSVVAAPLFKKIARRILALHGIAPERPMPVRISGEQRLHPKRSPSPVGEKA